MSLPIEKFLFEIELPKQYFNADFDIYDRFKAEAEHFLNLYSMCDGNEFPEEKKTKIQEAFSKTHEDIKGNISSILKIFQNYENANNKAAQEEFDGLMDRLKNSLFITTIDDFIRLNDNGKNIWTSLRTGFAQRYFRVRPVGYENPYIHDHADELFHIPLSKRAYASNERFSLAGFPCLYLATMLPLAWQECNYPQKYYYSEYQYHHIFDPDTQKRLFEQELKFVSLYSPHEIYAWGIAEKHNHFNLWLDLIIRYLKQYPLILACAFVNQTGKVSFKQEYIIPQMLMQWVQRNKHLIQGISYFSCINSYMQNSKWCAYNIVIPAIPPYDENKYSQKLRDCFTWTTPYFFTAPIADKQANSQDRKFIYDFIGKARNAMRKYVFPHNMSNFLRCSIELSCSLLNLLEHGDTIHMDLALHMLDSLTSNYGLLKAYDLKELTNEATTDTSEPYLSLKQDVTALCLEFENIYYNIIENKTSAITIGSILDKYRWISWNESYQHTEMEILYTDITETVEPIKFFKENNLLYHYHKLSAEDGTISYLKEISKITNTPLSNFWNNFVDDIEWMKTNIQNIKSPIILKENDIHRHSTNNNLYEFCHFGFDKEKLIEVLNLK